MNSTKLAQDNTWYLHRELNVGSDGFPSQYELPKNHSTDEGKWIVEFDTENIKIFNILSSEKKLYRSFEVKDFVGVVLQVFETDKLDTIFAISLSHKYMDFWLPLFVSYADNEVIEKWQGWSQTLSLPMLAEESDGSLRHPFSILFRLKEITPNFNHKALFKKMRTTGIWPVIKEIEGSKKPSAEKINVSKNLNIIENRKKIKIVKTDIKKDKIIKAKHSKLKSINLSQ